MPNAIIKNIKKDIEKLGLKHSMLDESLDSVAFAEALEIEALEVIFAYCIQLDYVINGFSPTALKDYHEDDGDLFEFEEKLRLYLDLVAIEKDDVFELYSHYHSIFWPDFVETKSEFKERIQQQLASGKFYNVELIRTEK